MLVTIRTWRVKSICFVQVGSKNRDSTVLLSTDLKVIVANNLNSIHGLGEKRSSKRIFYRYLVLHVVTVSYWSCFPDWILLLGVWPDAWTTLGDIHGKVGWVLRSCIVLAVLVHVILLSPISTYRLCRLIYMYVNFLQELIPCKRDFD